MAPLVLLSACGDDDSDGARPGDGTTEQVKIMTWAAVDNPNASAPQVRSAAQAAINEINRSSAQTGRTN